METNNCSAFRSFLVEMQAKHAAPDERKSLLSRFFGRAENSLFFSIPDQTKCLVLKAELKSSPTPSADQSLEQAIHRYGPLSTGYSTFISVLGPGKWANAIIRHPRFLVPLDFPTALANFVVMADNVDGQGGCVVFNPKDDSLNQRLYYACHDPAAYALLAESFEAWIYKLTDHWIKDPMKGYLDTYDLELVELES